MCGSFCNSGGLCLGSCFFLYDIDLVGISTIGELLEKSLKKHFNTLCLLHHKSLFWYVSQNRVLFKFYQLPSCNQLIIKTGNLERFLSTHQERIQHVFPKNLYQLLRTLFKVVESFAIPYMDDRKLNENMVFLVFDLICRMTSSTMPLLHRRLASTFQFLYQIHPIWLENKFVYAIPIKKIWLTHLLMSWWVTTTEQISNKISFWILRPLQKNISTNVLNSYPTSLSQGTSIAHIIKMYQKRGTTCIHTVLKNTKEPIFHLEDCLKRFHNVLLVFSLISANDDLELKKETFFLALSDKARVIEPKVIKKANQFVSFNFGIFHLFDCIERSWKN